MSYDLRIWEQPRTLPAPKTVEDAGRLMQALEVETPGPNPKFIQFAQKLVARYPSDPDGNDSIWLGNPVEHARNAKEAVFAISLPEFNRPKIMRFVVEAANELGLTVFDDQLGIAFLPGGKVLPEEGKEMWDELKDELDAAPVAAVPWSKAQARKELIASMTIWLGKHGFKARKLQGWDAAFLRDGPYGNQEINFYLASSGGEHACSMVFAATLGRVEEIYEEVCGENWNLGGTGRSLLLGLEDLNGESKFALEDKTDIEALGALIESKALPILDRCRTFKDLDRLLNVEGALAVQTRHKFATLIVARLAGNPNFDALVREFPQRFDKYPDEARQKLAQLTAYLKESVQPA